MCVAGAVVARPACAPRARASAASSSAAGSRQEPWRSMGERREAQAASKSLEALTAARASSSSSALEPAGRSAVPLGVRSSAPGKSQG